MPHFADPEIYRDILDELQIGVSVLDLQGKIVFWSDGAEKIAGYSRIDVLGHSCTENILLHCNHIRCEMCGEHCPPAAALRNSKPVESMGSIRHKSGFRSPVRMWAIPLRDRHGSIIGVIQTFESEFAVNGPDPNDRSMKERGCLDYATELPNQTMMHSHLRESLGIFEELKIPFAVLCLEIKELDKFRARYGQEAAITVLRAVARTLRNSVWPADFVGRWGGEQFMAILSGCDEQALNNVTARMEQVAARLSIQWWGQELSVAVSISSANAVMGDSVESLLRRAGVGSSQTGGSRSELRAAAGRSG
jgi:diguanylate cyclase (GGDEF)-like protein/PAS domain S-box-containing protein